jgi:hypothetical protein
VSLGGIIKVSAVFTLRLVALGLPCCAPDRPPAVAAPDEATPPRADGGAAQVVAERDAADDSNVPAATVLTIEPVTAPAPLVDRDSFADSELARKEAPVPLGRGWIAPAPTVTRGSCWVRYPEAPADAAAAFVARNGPDWTWMCSRCGRATPQTDRFSGTVVQAQRGRPNPVGPKADLSAVDVALRARDAARANADLLGLVEADFDRLDWLVLTEHPVTTLVGWTVSASTRDRVPPPPFPSIARRVRLYFTLHRDGVVISIGARVEPEVSVCTTAGLTPDQARHAPGIVGHALFFSDIAGRRVDVGAVTPSDVGPAELTVERTDQASSREYRLMYRVLVRRSEEPWYFYVDAWTGTLLAVAQGFQT